MPLPMARLASSRPLPSYSSSRTPLIRSNAPNNSVVSTPRHTTAYSQPSDSVAAAAPEALQQDTTSSDMDQAMNDQPQLMPISLNHVGLIVGHQLPVVPHVMGKTVFRTLPVVPTDMAQMGFVAGCPCIRCRQMIAQQRQSLNDWARNLDGLEALMTPSIPPATRPATKTSITKLPKEILNMIVAYVMDGIHDWDYTPPKAPLYAQNHPSHTSYTPSKAKRGAGFLTNEKLRSLSQTCKLFQEVCAGFGARDYMTIWAEHDQFVKDDLMRLSCIDRSLSLVSRVKHLIIRPPGPSGRIYASRPYWDNGAEAYCLRQVHNVIQAMPKLVSVELYSQWKYDTLRKALLNRSFPTVRSLTLDSQAAMMGTIIRSFPNLRVLRSRSTAMWDRADNETFKSVQPEQPIETACFLGTRDRRGHRQHHTPWIPLGRLPHLKHLFWEFNRPHSEDQNLGMIEALRGHPNVTKFTMLRYTTYDRTGNAPSYDDEEATANLYFNHVHHLEEIGICNARDFPRFDVDGGKVFVRIRSQPLPQANPVGKDGDGSGLNKNNKVEKTTQMNNTNMPLTSQTGNTGETSKTNKTNKTNTGPREIRKLIRVYDGTQSNEYRIKQLELGHIPSTPDRGPSPVDIDARDPEYWMFELEWRWAKHQTLKAALESDEALKVEEAAARAAAEAAPKWQVLEAAVTAVAAADREATRQRALAGRFYGGPMVMESTPFSAGNQPAGNPAVYTSTAVAGIPLSYPSSVFGHGSAAIPASIAPWNAAHRGSAGPHTAGSTTASASQGETVPSSNFGGGAATAANHHANNENPQGQHTGNASVFGSGSGPSGSA
ncbi:hypothetical protein B0T20DRAFT_180459 [Sordaria brevicollis]|uniref:F-box domain-containing protein n=1 Tax=Sordaria brevicollis TaxID=83679 RepID=A0AAE0PI50_SORBR|nr:hypothetical protein B0T20DRAFT_180459 [Sordaria brevicollis]